MATKKTTTKTTHHSTGLTLNKFSFWMIVFVTILYLVGLILSLCGVQGSAVGILQGIATACMIVIVSILAWRYVKPREMILKILYIICLLVVIAGIIIPLVK